MHGETVKFEWLVCNRDDSVILKRVAWMKCDGMLLIM